MSDLRDGANVKAHASTLTGIARPPNSCHRCGTTAYKSVIARDALGVMRPNGQYQCVQCKFSFTELAQWRRT